MTVWGAILSVFIALAGLAVLLLSLFHVRYRAGWRAEWGGLHDDTKMLPSEGFAVLEYGFPGFMRTLKLPDLGSSQSEERGTGSKERGAGSGGQPQSHDFPHSDFSSSRAESAPSFVDIPAFSDKSPRSPLSAPRPALKSRKGFRDPHRWRRALFRLATDAPAWKLLARYGFRVLRLAHRLLRPRLALSLGHPDPALLGRLAGYWSAASPLLPLGGATMNYRFQDRRPSLGVRVEGGFSALSVLVFGAGLVLVFPWIGMGRRAWRGWRGHGLTGWRAWAYKRLQTHA